MRRSLPVKLQVAAAAICTLTFLGAPAAHAFTLFDVGSSSVATLTMSRLPAWVQVANTTARLYLDDASDAFAEQPSQYTFLRVLGGGPHRLQVTAYDDTGTPTLSGWVDATDVEPSAPGTDWLVASTSTTLWQSTDSSAKAVRGVDPFMPMQRLDGPVQNRVEVQLYSPDFNSALDLGWIDLADTGPALPPRIRVAPATGVMPAARTLSSSNDRQTFLNNAAAAARAAAAQTGVPASVTVAQAILESDWGRSTLALDANNYFGMKAIGRLGTDGVVWMPTGEYDSSGQPYDTVSPFRAYKSLTDSVADHDRLLTNAARYATAMQLSNDPKQFAEQLSEAGYSTDPSYADKLVALMDGYDLYRLDA